MRSGISVASAQGEVQIHSELWKSALVLKSFIESFERKVFTKRSPSSTQHTIRIQKLPMFVQNNRHLREDAFAQFCSGKIAHIRDHEESQGKSTVDAATLETHFLLHFLPKVNALLKKEDLIKNATFELQKYSKQGLTKHLPSVANRYYRNALCETDTRESAFTSRRTRTARLDFISKITTHNLKSMVLNWANLDVKHSEKLFTRIKTRLDSSRSLMHVFWYHFWRGDTLGSSGPLCILSFIHTEAFKVLCSDVNPASTANTSIAEPYSVLPTHSEIFTTKNLPFEGSSIAQRAIFSASRVTHLYLCENYQVPSSTVCDGLIMEYFTKYHAVFQHHHRKSTHKESPESPQPTYGEYICIPNIWRLMLKHAVSTYEPRPLHILNLLRTLKRIDRMQHLRKAVPEQRQRKLTPLEALQESLQLKISLAKKEITQNQETLRTCNGKNHRTLSREKQLGLLITASKNLLNENLTDLQNPFWGYTASISGQTSKSTRRGVFAPAGLRSFFDTIIRSYPLQNIPSKIDFKLLETCMRSIVKPITQEASSAHPFRSYAANVESSNNSEITALWYGWKAAAIALERSVASITDVSRRVGNKAQRFRAHEAVQWRALSAVCKTLQFSASAAFCVLCIRLFSPKCIAQGNQDELVSNRAIRAILEFVDEHIGKAGDSTYFLALCMALFAVEQRWETVLSMRPGAKRRSPVNFAVDQVNHRILIRGSQRSPRHRKRESALRVSTLNIPLLVCVVPNATSALVSSGHWQSAFKIHITAHKAFGSTIHTLQCSTRLHEESLPYACVSRSNAARILLQSGSPSVWRKAAALLYPPSPVKGEVPVHMSSSEQQINAYNKTQQVFLGRLCASGYFSDAATLVRRSHSVLLPTLSPVLLHVIAKNCANGKNGWKDALKTADVLFQVVALHRPSVSGVPKISPLKEALNARTWQLCLRYVKCNNWLDTLAMLQKDDHSKQIARKENKRRL